MSGAEPKGGQSTSATLPKASFKYCNINYKWVDGWVGGQQPQAKELTNQAVVHRHSFD